MSARSFRSVFMVASCAGAALGCYLVSLRVASERAALEQVETRIVLAQRDIRVLQTEIGTRGRLAQLERWNVRVLALSAPSAEQFLDGGFALAKLTRPQPKAPIEAPVVLASASADTPKPQLPRDRADDNAEDAPSTEDLMHVAGLKLPAPEETQLPRASKSPPPRPATLEKRRDAKAAPRQATARKSGDKKVDAPAKPVTTPVRTAKVDPLAPLPTGPGSSTTTKETGPTR